MQLFKKLVSASYWLLLFTTFLCIFGYLKLSDGLKLYTISPGRPLYYIDTLISEGGKFELGFFDAGGTGNIYIAIWYSNGYREIVWGAYRAIVWVANRETPIRLYYENPRLVLDADGSLIICSDYRNETIWAPNISAGFSSVPKEGILHDDGNFVLSDGHSVIWQSFDYPTDTWLPGMKLGIDGSSTNKVQQLTSWKSRFDPAPGDFSVGINSGSGRSPELFMWMKQSQIMWRSGAWKGTNFENFPSLEDGWMYFSYISNSQSNYFTLNISTSTIFRFDIGYDGVLRHWEGLGTRSELLSSYPSDTCNRFGLCGPNSFCTNSNSPPCACYKGFKPRSLEEWNSGNWSGGCISTKPLQCFNGFYPVPGISMPLNSQSRNLDSPQICAASCLDNCSCTAYAYYDSRCSLWTGDLLGSRVTENSQEDLFVRSSEVFLANQSQSNAPKHSNIPIAVFIAVPLLIIISLTFLLWRIWRKKHMKQEVRESKENLLYLNLEISNKQSIDSSNLIIGSTPEGEKYDFNLPQFSFSSISAATNNFSPENKLGEGGFGPVYKGKLLDGHLVAVKRLSKRSEQGLEELRNETVLIAKLQHRNLVRLLGCCIEQDEKILIYEYMANKSLDCFIFDPTKQVLLDWSTRVQIIEGIAQGLLYLHQHSRLRIVHRDLKASNILLDNEMNPKISDFGMARIFGGDVLQENTNRVMGTYGYMSPEYAMEGLFSIKSDVFAFGVLLLEILSGKKNTGFRHSDCLSLLGYAWELWRTDRVLELIDSNLELPTSFLPLRFIHVGLLCVQESPADRPTMSDVLAMFGNELFKLVSPKRPAFTSGGSVASGIDKAEHCSVNNMLTVSVMDGR